MACYHPWLPSSGGRVRPLACGQCIGCKLEFSRQWAVRCMHEAKLHARNCFITLTYKDAPLSLVPRDFTLFMKRLRFAFPNDRIRYYMGGEYGEIHRRPHYHACLFNFDFSDRVYYRKSGQFNLYTSKVLESLWGLGFCTVSDFSFETAAYVSRYVTQKLTHPDAEGYEHVDLETGEIHSVLPEYGRMSRHPGIGADWIRRFRSDVYPDGQVVVNGRLARAPRYYDKLYRRSNAGGYAVLAAKRHAEACQPEVLADGVPGRVEAKGVVAAARLRLKNRSL